VNYAYSARASQQISAFYAAVLRRSNDDERAASLVEYVLLISLMALACFVAAKYLGTSTARPYSGAASGLEG
jgi:Flp pilus assembly pilin Flp